MPRARRLPFTKLSGTELGVAVVLTLVSLFILRGAWRDFRAYDNFGAAQLSYGAGEQERILGHCEAALDAHPEHRFAGELWAKVKVDLGDLDDAEKVYQDLCAKHPLAEAPDIVTARLGLAVIALRRYDKDRKAEWLAKAGQALDQAASAPDAPPEVEILRGQLDLRRNQKDSAAKRFAAAQESKSPPTLEGLVDLYTGLGAIANAKGNFRAARDAYRAAYELQPSQIHLLSNTALMEAQFYAGDQVTVEHLTEDSLKPIHAVLQEMQTRISGDPERFGLYRQSRLSIITALVSAFLRHRHFDEAQDRIEEAESIDHVPKEIAQLWRAELCLRRAVTADLGDAQRRSNWGEAVYAYERALKNEFMPATWGKDGAAAAKARIFNNRACLNVRCEIPQAVERGIELLTQAMDLAPKGLVFRRNRAVLNEKAGKPEAALDDYRKCLELSPSADLRAEIEGAIVRLSAAGAGEGGK